MVRRPLRRPLYLLGSSSCVCRSASAPCPTLPYPSEERTSYSTSHASTTSKRGRSAAPASAQSSITARTCRPARGSWRAAGARTSDEACVPGGPWGSAARCATGKQPRPGSSACGRTGAAGAQTALGECGQPAHTARWLTGRAARACAMPVPRGRVGNQVTSRARLVVGRGVSRRRRRSAPRSPAGRTPRRSRPGRARAGLVRRARGRQRLHAAQAAGGRAAQRALQRQRLAVGRHGLGRACRRSGGCLPRRSEARGPGARLWNRSGWRLQCR